MAFFLGTNQNHSPSVAKPRGLVPETSPGLVPRKDGSPSFLLLWTRRVLMLVVIDLSDGKVPIILCGHWLATIINPCNSIGLLVAFQRLKPLDPIYCLANGLPPLKTKAINLLERGGFSLFVEICQFTKVAENHKPFEYLPYFVV